MASYIPKITKSLVESLANTINDKELIYEGSGARVNGLVFDTALVQFYGNGLYEHNSIVMVHSANGLGIPDDAGKFKQSAIPYLWVENNGDGSNDLICVTSDTHSVGGVVNGIKRVWRVA